MEFRIGVNLGDVTEEDERICGDGVNIAARVEGLASAGGIAISGTVYEHIKDKLSLTYKGKPVKVQKVAEDLGVQYVLEGSVQMSTDRVRSTAHLVIGAIYVLKRQYEKSIAQAERVIAINPNGASNNVFMAGALGVAGRWEVGMAGV